MNCEIVVCACPAGTSLCHHHDDVIECPVVLRWYSSPGYGDIGIAGVRWCNEGQEKSVMRQLLLPVKTDGTFLLDTATARGLLDDLPKEVLECLLDFLIL